MNLDNILQSHQMTSQPMCPNLNPIDYTIRKILETKVYNTFQHIVMDLKRFLDHREECVWRPIKVDCKLFMIVFKCQLKIKLYLKKGDGMIYL